MGGLSAGVRHRAGFATSGADSDTSAVGWGVEKIAGAAVGQGSSGVVHIGVDGPCSEGGNGSGIRGISDVTGSVWGNRAGGGGVLWRGERRRLYPSPLSLNNSASHHLSIAFLVRLAGGGDGISEELGSEDSGGRCSDGECSGSECLGGECSGGECSGGKCSGDECLDGEGLDTGGSDSEGSGRGDVKFPLGCGGAPGAVEAGAVTVTGFALLPTVMFRWQRQATGAAMLVDGAWRWHESVFS